MASTRWAEDGELLLALGHDVGAFEAFYRRHVGRVSAYAARRCATPADVADVVAQTFVRLLEVADRFDPDRGSPLAYLFAIESSVVHDHHRSARRQRRLVFRLAGRDLLDADDTERIDAAIDAARVAPTARDLLRNVPEEQSAVLRMVADGVSTTQAAKALGISPGTARVRLFRARHRIRQELAQGQEER
jgi:RNA polymerase sigma factor (sigma-70 family)